MEAADALASAPRRSAGRRLADLFHGRPRLQVGALLAGPVGWLVIGYLGSLAVLLVAAFWSVDAAQRRDDPRASPSTTSRRWSTSPSTARSPGGRSGSPRLVTLTDALLAFPIAFYMAKVASRGRRPLLVVAMLMPLWSFYLVKVYAWRTMLSTGGRHQLGARPARAPRPRLRQRRGLAGDELPLAAVHDPADLRRARADPELAAQRLRGPRRVAADDLPAGDPAARLPGRRRRLDLHLLADAGRLHHAAARLATTSSSATSSTPTSPTTCRWPRRSRWCRSW